MGQAAAPLRPALLRALGDVSAALDSVADAQPVYLTTGEKEELLLGLRAQISRLEALEARTVGAAGDVAAERGARSAGAWLAHAARLDPEVGARVQRLADAQEQTPIVTAAHARGVVTTDQARVIGAAIEALPADLDPDVRADAEEFLVGQAAIFRPRDLRVLGRKVLDVVAPDLAEAHEAKLLAAQEAAARETASITHRRLGDGRVRASVVLPEAVMDRFLTLLHAIASPRRNPTDPGSEPAAGAPEDRRPHKVRLAHALQDLLERIPTDWLPQHGGTTTSVVVTIDATRLDQQLAAAGLTTGTSITAGEARRLACGAGILPMVLDGKSQPLDLGRTRRLFSAGQRKAFAVRDRQCRAEGCDIPAAWCEAHHLTPWSRGGPTDLDHAALLCSFHHHRAHDPAHHLTHLPDGSLRFHRRT